MADKNAQDRDQFSFLSFFLTSKNSISINHYQCLKKRIDKKNLGT